MQKILFIVISIFFTFNVQAKNLCTKYESNPQNIKLLKSLSKKLYYSFSELCEHPRILDIQKELRDIYHLDTDSYEEHEVFTLHYNEYSCEYHFNKSRQSWGKQYCYNTF